MTSAHVHPWLFWKLEAFRNESFFWCHFPKCSFGANLIFLMYSKQLYLSYYHKAPIFISAKKTYHSAKPTDQQRQSLMTMHEQCLLYDKQCLLFHHYVTLVARFYWQILVANCCNVHCTSDALFLIFLKLINHERVFRHVLSACRATCRRILDVDIRLGLQ